MPSTLYQLISAAKGHPQGLSRGVMRVAKTPGLIFCNAAALFEVSLNGGNLIQNPRCISRMGLCQTIVTTGHWRIQYRR